MGWLFLSIRTCIDYFFPRWSDWNQNSRLRVELVVVDKGTTAIDDYVSYTGDYAYYNGRYYSDKAPGLALLGIPIYALLRHTVRPLVLVCADSPVCGSGALRATRVNAGGDWQESR